MSIYKRGKIYWYKFMWNGEMVRESTRQPNQNAARQIEAAHRASLAKGEVGIREKKVVSTLADFISQRFEPWAEAATSAKTWLDYYRPGIRTIQAYKPLANLRLNEITSEKSGGLRCLATIGRTAGIVRKQLPASTAPNHAACRRVGCNRDCTIDKNATRRATP